MTQRRSNVSRARVDGDRVQTYWSLNLRGVRFYLSLALLIFSIYGISVATVYKTGEDIFKEQLDQFHSEAIPAISKIMDEKIEHHYMESKAEYSKYIAEFRQGDALVEQRLNEMDRRLENMERMIERIYNARFNGG